MQAAGEAGRRLASPATPTTGRDEHDYRTADLGDDGYDAFLKGAIRTLAGRVHSAR